MNVCGDFVLGKKHRHDADGVAIAAPFAEHHEAEAAATLAGRGDDASRHAHDARRRNIAHDGGAVGKRGGDDRLVADVGARDVGRRVGFGVAEGLGACERLLEGEAAPLHVVEHVVAGAVEDARDVGDLVEAGGLLDHLDPVHAASTARFEEKRDVVGAGKLGESLEIGGHGGLVGCDDVLAGRKRGADVGEGGVAARESLDDARDLGVVQHGLERVGHQGAVRVAGSPQNVPDPDPAVTLVQKFGHGAADGSVSKQSDVQLGLRFREGRFAHASGLKPERKTPLMHHIGLFCQRLRAHVLGEMP